MLISSLLYSSDVINVIHPDEVSLKIQNIDAVKFNVKMDASRVRIMYYFSKDMADGSLLNKAVATLYYWPKSKDGNVDLLFYSKIIENNIVEYVFPDGEKFYSRGLGRLAEGGQFDIENDVFFPLICSINSKEFPGNNVLDLIKGDDSKVESYCLFGIQSVKISEIVDPRFKIVDNELNGFSKFIDLHGLNDRILLNRNPK